MSATDSLQSAYFAAPPIARTFATVVFALSLANALDIVSAWWWYYDINFLWQFPPQLWRLATCFMVTGPGLGLLFDTYFLYRYMADLESGHPRFPRKADLVWYLMFVCSAILVIDYFMGFHFSFYLSGLIIAMVYTVTQDQRGQKANFYFINIPAQLLPVCMILVNFLMPGGVGQILQQLEGLIAAHLFDFLNRILPEFGGFPNVLATPNWFHGLLQSPRVVSKGYGTAMHPSQSSGSSSGASRGPLPDSWRTRGPGRRLG